MNKIKDFQVGDWVEWTSQAQGSAKTKRGEIIAVIAANSDPYLKKRSLGTIFRPPEMGGIRDHDSFLVALKMSLNGRTRKVYWPVVSKLVGIERWIGK